MERCEWEALAEAGDLAALAAALDAPGDLFGGDDSRSARSARGLYLALTRAAHPDRHAGSPLAQAVQARIGELWQARGAVTLTSRRGSYRLGPPLAVGDLADVHAAGGDLVVKLARRPQGNALLEAEAATLRRLNGGDPRMAPYVPVLIDAFTVERRRATVLRRVDGAVTLAEVAAAQPDGLDPRDAAWMWRRLLVALGHAHRAGVVHAAVLPEHVLVLPADHGLVLLDWCYAVEVGRPGRAIVRRHADDYPREVTAREPLHPGTDIAMAAGLLLDLMGSRAPAAFHSFARGCRLPSLAARPRDAWVLLAELDDLLDRLWGPRTFRPFLLSAQTA